MTNERLESMSNSEQMPEIVYHYTSVDTMMKIVDTRVIRATSIKFLNDTRERDGFLAAAMQQLPSLFDDPAIDKDVLEEILEDLPSISENIVSIPLVASFSREPDSLPQWRSYCSDGNGVSIGFDVKALRRARVKGDKSLFSGEQKFELSFPARFEAVKYFRPTDVEGVRESIRTIYRGADVSFQQASSLEYRGSLKDFFKTSLELQAATYKDHAFETEREYRLLVSGVYFKPNLLKFRANRSTVVPFVELEIPTEIAGFADSIPWDAIRTVKIGPTTNRDLTQMAVNAYFRSLNMPVHVDTTDIPYRDW